MILRKPYAFLIRHFKLIHLILVILSCYSIYRTRIILEFFNEYILNTVNVIGQNLKPELVPTIYPIVSIIIILLTTIILFLMIIKKKPNIFYFFNIIVYIIVLISFLSVNSTLEMMENSLVDIRIIRFTRDFVMISFFLQLISIPIEFIRAIGFNVKKFDFRSDLREMDISDDDKEEFEVRINFDKNKLKRKFNRMKRNFKYTYKENKALVMVFIVAGLISSMIYTVFNYIFRPVPINQNVNFTGNGFVMNVTNSYVVNTDYKGNIIDDDYYLLLKVKIRSVGMEKKLDIATTKILIGNYTYTPILTHKDKFIDIGSVYQNEKIGLDFEEKILLYKIPKQLINDEIIFSFVNKNNFSIKEGFKNTKVKIEYKDLTGINSIKQLYLGNEFNFSDSIIERYKINIYDYEINQKFKLEYNYCISNECFPSFEYLTPKVSSNYDKTILRLKGSTKNEEKYDFQEFVEKFGKICYTIDGVLKKQTLNSNNIITSKNQQNNDVYIELPREVQNASDISIVFIIHDRLYEYVLK